MNNDEKQCSNGMKRLVTVSNDMEQSIDRSRLRCNGNGSVTEKEQNHNQHSQIREII